jgi:hypothetical protein
LQVIVCASHPHDAQSPSLKQGSPDPVGPGVHEGTPLLEELLLEELLPAPHIPVPMAPGPSHWLGHAVSRQVAVVAATAEGVPQLSALVQLVTEPPW